MHKRGDVELDPGGMIRPAVTVAWAQTLDGRIATRNGESQWISSANSLDFSHELRASHDAVLIGVGTVVRDNPRLTVRLISGESPRRIILDSTLRTPLEARVLGDDRVDRTILAATNRATPDRIAAVRGRGARVLVLPTDGEGRVSLAALARELADNGIRSVLVEGGAGVITSMLRARLVDRIVICIAPKIMGAGIEAVGDLGVGRLAQALTFREHGFRHVGEDIVFEGQIEPYLLQHTCLLERASGCAR